MKREEMEGMEELFRVKISLELGRFKRRVLKLEPEEIYAKAYRIDCMVNIYEMLLEISQEIEEDALRIMLAFPNLLAFLYGRWLKKEDSSHKELQECLDASIENLQSVYRMLDENKKTAA